MAQEKQTGLGDDELFGTPMAEAKGTGSTKGEFIAPPDVPDVDEPEDALPEQEEFWRPPARFGTVPVEAGEHLFVESDPESMVEAVARLISDEEVWQLLSENGRALIRRRYLAEAAYRPLDEVLSGVGAKT